jgi:hypothetical protein
MCLALLKINKEIWLEVFINFLFDFLSPQLIREHNFQNRNFESAKVGFSQFAPFCVLWLASFE